MGFSNKIPVPLGRLGGSRWMGSSNKILVPYKPTSLSSSSLSTPLSSSSAWRVLRPLPCALRFSAKATRGPAPGGPSVCVRAPKLRLTLSWCLCGDQESHWSSASQRFMRWRGRPGTGIYCAEASHAPLPPLQVETVRGRQGYNLFDRTVIGVCNVVARDRPRAARMTQTLHRIRCSVQDSGAHDLSYT